MELTGPVDSGAASGERYCFGEVVVDAVAHTLVRDGRAQAVEPKAFAVLLVLLRHAGELINRDQLLDAVWGHRHVTPGVLTRAIAQLRAALGDHPHQPRFIQTQHALGYRFIGELREPPDKVAPPAPRAPEPPLPSPSLPRPPAPVEPGAAYGPGGGAVGGVMGPAAGPPPEPVAAPSQPMRASMAGARALRPAAGWVLFAGALLLVLAALAWFRRDDIAPRPEPSIAVLPFSSLSDRPDDRYFAQGLAVEMHDALAGVPGLKVAARTGAVAAQGQDPDPKALGQRLGVATVLEASVRRDGPRVRINARLSDTHSGFILWSRSYDREATDVFALQSEIAQEVVRALLGVLPGQAPRLSRRLTPTRDITAYQAYLEGLQRLEPDRGERQPEAAIAAFRQALTADPRFARAQAGICRAEIMRFEDARDTPAFERAQAACRRAARMDPELREVSLALGEMHRVRGEFEQATAQYTRALDDISLRPAAYIGLARTQGAQGHDALALEYFELARRLRPGDDTIYREIGYHQYLNGDLPAAIASFRTATGLLPDDADLWSSLGGLYLAAGDAGHAAAAFERSLALEPSYGALSNYGTLRYEQGAYAEAADLYRHAAELDPDDYRIWGNIGDALAARADTAAQAREPYERAARMAQRYVEVKASDAQALALLAWYRANLGQAGHARERLAQAEALATERGEVAFCNAQTLALLGDAAAARERLAQAREAGIPRQRIHASPVLRALLAGATGLAQTHGGA